MDYADNFNPKPIKGEKYTTTDGKVVIVDDIQPDEGVVYVFCHYEGDAPNTMFPNKDEWEAMFSAADAPTGGSDPVNAPTGGSTPVDAPAGSSAPVDTPTGGSTPVDAPAGSSAPVDTPTGGSTPVDAPTGGSIPAEPIIDNDFNEYLRKVVEPINRLKKLLQNGITLPFQILKLESDEEIPAQFSDPNVTNTCQDEINKIEALRKEGEKDENRGSWVEEKMWSFGAFDKPMLRMLKQDHGAKTGLGAAIFMTSLLACCTGTYAFYKISDNTFLAFIVGLIWGTMIYVLDRNIVASMAYTGERHKVRQFFKSFCTVGLRLIISVFIGVVISTPIEMLIFSGKIDEFKNFEHEQFVKNYTKEQKQQKVNSKVNEIVRLEAEKEEARQGQLFQVHENGGKGNLYKAEEKRELLIQEKLTRLRDELETIRIENERNDRSYREEAEKEWKKHVDFFDLSTDLAILYKVTATVRELDEIAKRDRERFNETVSVDAEKHERSVSTENEQIPSHNKKQVATSDKNQQTTSSPNLEHRIEETVINPALPKDDTMHYCRLFVTIFFILLEVIPVITKLFFKAGDYDKEMVRWSYLKAKLHRIENANSYNQTINGALSTHRKYILGDEFDDIAKALQSDENHENGDSDDIDNITLPIKGCLRTAQDYNDWRNLRRWKFAIMKADDYLEEEINKLFPQTASAHKPSQPVQPQQPQPLSTPVDPSAGGETID